MSFIHPDASLMDTERSHLDLRATAAAGDRVNGENEKQFSLEVERVNETRASNSSPRDQLQIKIVMLKVQVNCFVEQTLLVALSRILSGSPRVVHESSCAESTRSGSVGLLGTITAELRVH